MKVINLYGGPGVGKSTVAAELFVQLKKAGYNVELVPEYAKRMVYEERSNILSDQLYMLAKQHRSIAVLGHRHQNMDFVIVDSPLLMAASYNKHDVLDQNILNLLIKHLYDKYTNVNFLIKRNDSYGYNPNGRVQKTVEEADTQAELIEDQLNFFHVEYIKLMNNDDVISNIIGNIYLDNIKNGN